MQEERLQILKMIEAGTVSADEGSKLLEALDAEDGGQADGGEGQWLRIRVEDVKRGKSKVNLNVPLGLLDMAIKFIPKDAVANLGNGQQPIDIAGIVRAIKSGARGKIVEVEQEEEGLRIEITVH